MLYGIRTIDKILQLYSLFEYVIHTQFVVMFTPSFKIPIVGLCILFDLKLYIQYMKKMKFSKSTLFQTLRNYIKLV